MQLSLPCSAPSGHAGLPAVWLALLCLGSVLLCQGMQGCLTYGWLCFACSVWALAALPAVGHAVLPALFCSVWALFCSVRACGAACCMAGFVLLALSGLPAVGMRLCLPCSVRACKAACSRACKAACRMAGFGLLCLGSVLLRQGMQGCLPYGWLCFALSGLWLRFLP